MLEDKFTNGPSVEEFDFSLLEEWLNGDGQIFAGNKIRINTMTELIGSALGTECKENEVEDETGSSK